MKTTVKSVICFMLLIGIACTLAACREDYTGHYELISATMSGQTFTVEQLREIVGNDVQMFIELNADGTGKMAFLNSTADMQWEGDQIWAVQDGQSGTKATFTVDEGKLTLVLTDSVLVFQK